MYIIMLGAPGSGKGTVGTILSEKLNLTHISTGDIFRENIKKETNLGKEANSYISQGKLVPDELTNRIVEKRLEEKDVETGAILDGYPRTGNQCIELDKILDKQGKKVDAVIYLNVDDEEIIDRISKRRLCSNKECKEVYNLDYNPPKAVGKCDKCGAELIQREDDSAEVVKNRLEIYHKNAEELLDYYEKKGVLITERASDKENISSKDVAQKLVERFQK